MRALTPHLVCKPWGGNLFSSKRGLSSEYPLGESWEVSALSEGESLSEGKKLSSLIDPKDLPYLIKFIDTSDYLSVQVHPDEAYALKYESSQGKTECWLILEAKEGAGIYLGFKEGVEREDFEKALFAGEDMRRFLRFFPVKAGDFFYVPAGTIHAIGKDVFLAEVQESSGITYRVWDWNRPRELHREKAMDVLNFSSEANRPAYFLAREDLLSYFGETRVLEERLFIFDLLSLLEGETWERDIQNATRHMSLVCLEGEGVLSLGEQSLSFKAYDSFLVTKESLGLLTVLAKAKTHFIWVS